MLKGYRRGKAFYIIVIVKKYKKCNKNNPLTPFDKRE